MTIASQAELAARLARQRHPFTRSVLDAADAVDAALEPRGWRDNVSYIPGTQGYELTNGNRWSSCAYLGRADAGLYDRTVLWTTRSCTPWQEGLDRAVTALRDALLAVGDTQGAGVAGAVIDASQNQTQERDNLAPTSGDWWGTTPFPVKAVIVFAGVWFGLDIIEKGRRARG